MSIPPTHDLFACLDARRSTPSRLLAAPGPDDAALLRMLQSAVRVPDHGTRVPFRFLQITGDARDALGAALAERTLQRKPDVDAAVLDKERHRFSHAPLVIAVIARLGPDEKIPESERFSSASCVCFALLQAAHAAGFGAQWLTGWAAYDEIILRLLGVGGDEKIVGFIHIGTADHVTRERARPDPRELLSQRHPA
jgi:nitroreductase